MDWIIQTFTFKIFIFIIYFFKEKSKTASLLHLSKENEYFHLIFQVTIVHHLDILSFFIIVILSLSLFQVAIVHHLDLLSLS